MCINRQVAKGLLLGLLPGVAIGVITRGYGLVLWYPVMLADAIVVACKLNRGARVLEWEFF